MQLGKSSDFFGFPRGLCELIRKKANKQSMKSTLGERALMRHARLLPVNHAPLPARCCGTRCGAQPLPLPPCPYRWASFPPFFPPGAVSGPACAGTGDVTVFTRGSWHGSAIRNVENGARVESCAVLSAPLCCL